MEVPKGYKRAKVLPRRPYESPPLLVDVVTGDVLNLTGDNLLSWNDFPGWNSDLNLFSAGFAMSNGKAGETVWIVPWTNDIFWEVQIEKAPE